MSIESARMSDLDLLVPASLVDPALAPELLHEQPLPHLARVIARTGAVATLASPRRASLTSWQAWVFGTRTGTEISRVNLAELWAMACGIAPAPHGGRYLVEPAHFRIANDHLRLDDPRALAVTLAEARALVTAIAPVLADAGWRLDPIEPATLTHWLLVREDGAPLSAAAIEHAIGDNVAAWQPSAPDGASDRAAGDAAALAWRRCINEIQMMWFGHPVNGAREAEGKPSINTLWLSGNGASRTPMPHYRAIDSGLPLLAALPVEPDATRTLETFDGFIDPARRDDWSTWREQLGALDAKIGDVLRRQADGSVGAVTLVFCGRDGAKQLRIGPRDLAKFWRGWSRGPTAAELFAEEAPA